MADTEERTTSQRACWRWARNVLLVARAVTIGDMTIAEERAETARREFWLALEFIDDD